jgi:hypothetical protein
MRVIRMLFMIGLLGILGVRTLYAQEQGTPGRITLSGFVTDSTTGERLPGANLYVPARGTGTVANDYGFYSLTLPADSVVLRVSYIGYHTRAMALRLEADQTLVIALTPASMELDPVDVVGERGENEVESTQMSAVTLPVAEIKKLPAFLGEVDVIKAIQLLPGVQSGTEGSTGLYVRGGARRRT